MSDPKSDKEASEANVYRHYTTSDLPLFTNPEEEEFTIAKTLYSEIQSNYRHLADIRFKLLGFVPAISVIAWAQMLAYVSITDLMMTVVGFVIAFLGFRVTHGLRIYDRRNDELYDDLISRGRKIEALWKIHTGIFKGRKKGVQKDFMRGFINHGRGLRLVYSSVYLGWGLLVLWYGIHCILQLLHLKNATA
ncbi:MAG: hypothetical protein AAGF77_04080 [Bacteroidota bacterium]